MKNITKSIRLTDEQERYINSQGQSFNDGLSKIIERYMYIDKYSKNEIKGKFTPAEWSFLADSLNGSIMDGQFRCNQGALIYHCEDAEKFEGTATKWGITIPAISKKIKVLSCAQINAVYCYVEQFWDGENHNLEEWSKGL